MLTRTKNQPLQNGYSSLVALAPSELVIGTYPQTTTVSNLVVTIGQPQSIMVKHSVMLPNKQFQQEWVNSFGDNMLQFRLRGGCKRYPPNNHPAVKTTTLETECAMAARKIRKITLNSDQPTMRYQLHTNCGPQHLFATQFWMDNGKTMKENNFRHKQKKLQWGCNMNTQMDYGKCS